MPKFKVGDKVLCVTQKDSNYSRWITRGRKLNPNEHAIPGSVNAIAEVFEEPGVDDYLVFSEREFGENARCFVRAYPWNLVYYRMVLYLKKVFHAT